MFVRFSHSAIGLFVTLLIVAGCDAAMTSKPVAPLPEVAAPELLIDARAFPAGWEIFPCPPDRCLGTTHADRYFGNIPVPGHVIQDVYRLENVDAAKAKYDRYRDVDFRVFSPPSQINYRSAIADDYYLGCGVDKVPACRAIFRYGRYFVYFYFSIEGGIDRGLRISEVEPILRAMDARASAVLGVPLPTVTP